MNTKHRSFTPYLIVLLLWIMTTMGFAQNRSNAFWKRGGAIRNANVAQKVAEAILSGYYGEEQVRRQMPLKAVLKNGIWTVKGKLPQEFSLGGVAEISIRKSDGKVIRIIHGK